MRSWQGCWCAGLMWICAITPVMGQGWQPVYVHKSDASLGIQLGKPVRYTRPIEVGKVNNDDLVRPASASEESLFEHSTRYQSPTYPAPNPYPYGAPPPYASPQPYPTNPNPYTQPYPTNPNPYSQPYGGSPDEAFNCGVINDGSLGGGGAPGTSGGSGRSFWDRIFGPRSETPSGGGGGGGLPWLRSGPSRGTFQSDRDFPWFISPVSNPTYFEDPMAITEFRPLFFYQKAPATNSLMMGGNIFNFNFQGRLAWNDQWSLVIHRLGLAIVDPGPGALMGFGGGTSLTDIQVGPKWTFYRDDRTRTLAAVGANFDIPVGQKKVLSGSGSGGVTPYLSFAQDIYNFNIMASGGYRFGFGSKDNQFFYVSGHIDYGFYERFFPLAEVNWYHITKNGSRYPIDYGGGDLFNLGGTNSAGNNLLTVAAGFRFKFNQFVQMGAIYEMPVIGSDGIQKYRIGIDFIFRY